MDFVYISVIDFLFIPVILIFFVYTSFVYMIHQRPVEVSVWLGGTTLKTVYGAFCVQDAVQVV